MADDKLNPGFVDPDTPTGHQAMPDIDIDIGGSEECDEIDSYEPRPRRGARPVAVKGETLTKQQNADRWKNRRRMAYMSLLAIFIATGLLFFVVDESRLKILSEPVVWFYITMASIVGSYIGFSTYDDIGRRR